MAKLTNKERDVVIDEIYKLVSEPIIKENEIALETVDLPYFKYLEDFEVYMNLQETIGELQEDLNKIGSKYYRKQIEGFTFNYSPMQQHSKQAFITFQKNKLITSKSYPSKADIEREMILSGNTDIPTLIEIVVNKLKQ